MKAGDLVRARPRGPIGQVLAIVNPGPGWFRAHVRWPDGTENYVDIEKLTVEDLKPPEIGEMIYGCWHPKACGRVKEVIQHVTIDQATDGGMDHWIVKEWWDGMRVRVKREANGQLYEVQLVTWSNG